MMTAKQARTFVENVLVKNAETLGQPVALRAVVRNGNIVLERMSQPGIVARVLGSPEAAVEAAELAFLRAQTQLFGHTGL